MADCRDTAREPAGDNRGITGNYHRERIGYSSWELNSNHCVRCEMEKAGAGDASCEGALCLVACSFLILRPTLPALGWVQLAVQYASSFRFPRGGSGSGSTTRTRSHCAASESDPASALTACLLSSWVTQQKSWHTGVCFCLSAFGECSSQIVRRGHLPALLGLSAKKGAYFS